MSQNNVAYAMLTAEFPDSEVKSFNQAKEGKPPRWLSYVPDETVMDRLDAVFGPGRWSVTVAPTPTPTVALVTLSVKWPDNEEWTHYSDFGYPTNGTAGESLKEAVSDGIRRTARFVGIARYIYAGQVEAHPPAQAPAQPQRQAPPRDEDYIDADAAEDPDARCHQHGVKWFTTDTGTRMHQDGTWPDTGNKKWCIHPDDRKKR